jgi:hypothetical protein
MRHNKVAAYRKEVPYEWCIRQTCRNPANLGQPGRYDDAIEQLEVWARFTCTVRLPWPPQVMAVDKLTQPETTSSE